MSTEATAYHEAGHVVVGLATGRTLIEVVVSPDDSYAEFVPVSFEWPLRGSWWGTPRAVWRMLVRSVAGAVAEGMLYGTQCHDESDLFDELVEMHPQRVSSDLQRAGWERNNYRDAEEAATLARHLAVWAGASRNEVADVSLAIIRNAERKCARLLRARWHAVATIGECLVRGGGRLTGDEVAKLVNRT